MTTDAQFAGLALAALLLAVLVASGLGVFIRRSAEARRAARQRHPSRAALERVRAWELEAVPDEHEADAWLARLHDDLWPEAEWQSISRCRYPRLDRYTTPDDAEPHVDRARRSSIRACACGGHHIHYRDNRAIRPRAHH